MTTIPPPPPAQPPLHLGQPSRLPATPAEAVSWGKVNPGVLPDTVVAYCDSTIAFPLFCEYVVGAETGRRPLRRLIDKRTELVASLRTQALEARAARDAEAQ